MGMGRRGLAWMGSRDLGFGVLLCVFLKSSVVVGIHTRLGFCSCTGVACGERLKIDENKARENG